MGAPASRLYKTCAVCGIEKDIGFFVIDRKSGNYINPCKDCFKIKRKQYSKNYRQKHPEKLSIAKKEYRKANPEKCRLYAKSYAKRYPERRYESNKKWNLKNPEKCAKYAAARRARASQPNISVAAQLQPWYLNAVIVKDTHLAKEDIPIEFKELVYIYLKIKHLLKGNINEKR